MRLVLGKWGNTKDRLISNLFQRATADGGVLGSSIACIDAAYSSANNSSLLTMVPAFGKAGKLFSIIPESGAGDFTVVRNTTASYVGQGGLIRFAANNEPRFDWTNGCPALLVEPTATNSALHSRDLTNAVWVRTNMNATRDQVGADGSANTATRLTATAANATILQPLTLASAQRTWSAWIRRVTGTGRIEMTMNGGASWVIVTSSITGAFAPISIPAQTLANNSVGFRIADIGDEIAVDFVQLEAGVVRTSPIITGAATATRNADVISLTGASGLIGQTQGTIYAEVNANGLSKFDSQIITLSDGTANNRFALRMISATGFEARVVQGGVAQAVIISGAIPSSIVKIAMAYKVNDIVFYINGSQIGSDLSATIPATSQINIGSNALGTGSFNDRICAADLYTTRLANAELAQLTTL